MSKKTTREKMADHRELVVKRNRKPTENQQAFLDAFVENSRDASFDNYNEILLEAFKTAGYDYENGNALFRAKEILERHWDKVEHRLSLKIKLGAMIGADVLIKLATDAKQESVQLKAAIELLNKGGFKEADTLQVIEKPAEDMTHEERQEEIRKLMEKNGLQVAGSGEVQNT